MHQGTQLGRGCVETGDSRLHRRNSLRQPAGKERHGRLQLGARDQGVRLHAARTGLHVVERLCVGRERLPPSHHNGLPALRRLRIDVHRREREERRVYPLLPVYRGRRLRQLPKLDIRQPLLQGLFVEQLHSQPLFRRLLRVQGRQQVQHRQRAARLLKDDSRAARRVLSARQHDRGREEIDGRQGRRHDEISARRQRGTPRQGV